MQCMPTLGKKTRWEIETGGKCKNASMKCKRVIWGKTWEDIHRQRWNVTTSAFAEASELFWMSRRTGNLCMTCCLIYTLFPVGYHSLLSIWLQTRATIRNLGLCTSRLSHRAIYSRCFALSQTKLISIKTTTVLKKSLLRWRSPSWCSKVKR